MFDQPIAAYLATELVARQFRDDAPAAPQPPVRRPRPSVWRTRATLAELLGRAADVIAPSGYRVAH